MYIGRSGRMLRDITHASVSPGPGRGLTIKNNKNRKMPRTISRYNIMYTRTSIPAVRTDTADVSCNVERVIRR